MFSGAVVWDERPLPQTPDAEWFPNHTYEAEMMDHRRGKICQSRQHYYAAACGVEPALPVLHPIRADVAAWTAAYKDAVLLFPFVSRPEWNSRALMPTWWKCLIDEVRKAGMRPVVVGASYGDVKSFPCEYAAGLTPQHLLGLITAARATVCTDTGPAHLAGVARKPALVILGPTTPEVFGLYPSVRCLQGSLPCAGCWWASKYWSKPCDSFCASAHTVTPTKVVEELLNTAWQQT